MRRLRDPKRRLRWLLTGVFLALALPATVLTVQAYRQLRWEAFHQQRVLAEELVARIDSASTALIAGEEARAFTDYGFLIVTGERYIQRSPLSNLPPASELPGLVGYFQVDAEGRFSTPLLPEASTDFEQFALTAAEYDDRLRRQSDLRRLLAKASTEEADRAAFAPPKHAAGSATERQTATAPASAPARLAETAKSEALESTQSASLEDRRKEAEADVDASTVSKEIFRQFDLPDVQPAEDSGLSNLYGRVDELELDDAYDARSRRSVPSTSKRDAADAVALPGGKRIEQNRVVDRDVFTQAQAPAELPIGVFESEVDPFTFTRLDSEHFVLYRKVWREGQRFIQGAVVVQRLYLDTLIENAFRGAAVSRNTDLVIAYGGEVLRVIRRAGREDYLTRSSDVRGDLLLRTHLSAPADGLQLIFSVAQLPVPPGNTTITWAAAVIALVLCGGFLVIYQTGMRQIRLVEQQQDFVSAVSHELKTPLTSIRMYGEILKAGWAEEAKKRTYYDFIFLESERLTRLINNVLQLARLSRNEQRVELATIRVGPLLDQVLPKVSSAIDAAGFTLDSHFETSALEALVRVDVDAFAQVMINLVDNALKFSANAPRKCIQLGCRLRSGGIEFSVRDFGPGVAKQQMKKIFRLFYRAESELTRETVGTGIGLALVQQLVEAMHGKVDLVNRDPGAEFRVMLTRTQSTTA